MANKTNTFLIQSKYIGNIFQKKNFSIEKQRSNMSTISMNPGIPHKYMPNIQKRKDILINLNSFNPNNSSTTNISNTISLKKHSLNNSSNSGITIVFPNRNISRNIRMKSVDYESNLKLLNQTEQRVKNKNDKAYRAYIYFDNGTTYLEFIRDFLPDSWYIDQDDLNDKKLIIRAKKDIPLKKRIHDIQKMAEKLKLEDLMYSVWIK